MADTIGNLKLGIGVEADTKSTEQTANGLKSTIVATCSSINKSLAGTPDAFSKVSAGIQDVANSANSLSGVSNSVSKITDTVNKTVKSFKGGDVVPIDPSALQHRVDYSISYLAKLNDYVTQVQANIASNSSRMQSEMSNFSPQVSLGNSNELYNDLTQASSVIKQFQSDLRIMQQDAKTLGLGISSSQIADVQQQLSATDATVKTITSDLGNLINSVTQYNSTASQLSTNWSSENGLGTANLIVPTFQESPEMTKLINDINQAISKCDILGQKLDSISDKSSPEYSMVNAQLANQIAKTENLASKMEELRSKEAEIARQKQSEAQIDQELISLANSSKVVDQEKVNKENQILALKKKIADTESTINSLRAQQSQLSEMGKGSGWSAYEQLQKIIDATSESARQLQEELDKIQGTGGETLPTPELPAPKTGGWTSALNSIQSACNKLSSTILSVFKKITSVVKSSVANILGHLKNLSKGIKESSSSCSTAEQNFKKLFTTILKYGLGIRSTYFLFRKLRTALINGFSELTKSDSEVNQSISTLKSNLTQLKNQVILALAPALNALTPVLTNLIQLANKAAIALASIIAAITGQNSIKLATYEYEDYAKSIDKTTKSKKKATKETEKELKQLAKFDELNNLSKKDDTKTDDDDDEDTKKGGIKYTTAPIDKKWLDWVNKIKKILAELWEPFKKAWDKCKDYIISQFKRMVNNLKTLVGTIWEGFITAYKKYAEGIYTDLLKSIGNIFGIFANLFKQINTGLRKNNNYLKIWDAIFRIIKTISGWIEKITKQTMDWINTLDFTPFFDSVSSWLDSLVKPIDNLCGIIYDLNKDFIQPLIKYLVEDGFPSLLNVFTNFNKAVDWSKLRKNVDKIWKTLSNFFKKVGNGIVGFIDIVSKKISDFVNGEKFTAMIDKFSSWMDGFDGQEFADDLGRIFDALSGVASALFDTVGEIIALIIKNKDKIIKVFEYICKALEFVIKHWKLFVGIFVGANIVGILVGIFKKVMLVKAAFSLLQGVATFNTLASSAGTATGALTTINSSAGLATASVSGLVTVLGNVIAVAGAAIGGYAFGNWIGGNVFFRKDKELYEQYAGFEGFAKLIEDTHTAWGDWVSSIGENQDRLTNQIATGYQSYVQVLSDVTQQGKILSDTQVANVEKTFNLTSDQIGNLRRSALNVHPELKTLDSELSAIGMNDASVQTLNQIYQYLNSNLPQSANVTEEQLKEVFGEELTDGMKTFFSQVQDGTIDIQSLTDSLGIIPEKTKEVTQESFKAVTESASDLPEQMETIGEQSGAGYSRGLKQSSVETESKGFFSSIIDKVKSLLGIHSPSTVFSDIGKNTGLGFINGLEGLSFDNILTKFNSLWTSVQTGTTTAMSNLRTVISSTISNIGSALSSLVSSVRNVFSGITSGISSIGSRVSSFANSVGTRVNVRIPKLASGAVIPPNQQFLAMLGDQKHGTNIETPLSTMVDAFNQANKGGSAQEIALLQEQNDLLRQLLDKEFGITDSQIFKSVRNSASSFRKANGRSAFI